MHQLTEIDIIEMHPPTEIDIYREIHPLTEKNISIEIIVIIMRVIYTAPKNVEQTHRRSHCTSAQRITSILRHVAEAFNPARQGTILNSHHEMHLPPPSRYRHKEMRVIIGLYYVMSCNEANKKEKEIPVKT